MNGGLQLNNCTQCHSIQVSWKYDDSRGVRSPQDLMLLSILSFPSTGLSFKNFRLLLIETFRMLKVALSVSLTYITPAICLRLLLFQLTVYPFRAFSTWYHDTPLWSDHVQIYYNIDMKVSVRILLNQVSGLYNSIFQVTLPDVPCGCFHSFAEYHHFLFSRIELQYYLFHLLISSFSTFTSTNGGFFIT